MKQEELIKIVTEVVYRHIKESKKRNEGCTVMEEKTIPVGVSNRHVHLSQDDVRRLFGQEAALRIFKDLSQPGQYACHETVNLVGPKGCIDKVRVLGPSREKSQVEVSLSDCFKLGIQAPIRDSGDIAGSAPITLEGPVGSVALEEGCIIAARHIHMHTSDAKVFGVQDKDRVHVKTFGPRETIFLEVLVRVSDQYSLEMHVDIDEANAAAIKNGDSVRVVRLDEFCTP